MFRPLLLAWAIVSVSAQASPSSESAQSLLQAWQSQDPEAGARTVHLVYFTPSDTDPAPRFRERLSKIMDHISAFYAREMERNGFGKRAFDVARSNAGATEITLVQGNLPAAHYLRESGAEIRRECVPVLKAAGIEADRETLVIFCNLSVWDGATRTISQHSPYYASGTNRAGTAWQVDSPILDLDALTEKEQYVQDGEYGHISLGRYNSIFIGGIAHELGHALGLPHDCQRPEELKTLGHALMGSGNRTYGEELRGEGKGSFLTFAEALRLASHPAFSGSIKGLPLESNAQLTSTRVAGEKSFTCSGKVMATPPPYAVIGYMDPSGGGDYDAATCYAIPAADGTFTLECDALKPGSAGLLRLVVAQVNGAMSTFAGSTSRWSAAYTVAADGTVDLTDGIAAEKLAPLLRAVAAGEAEPAKSFLEGLRGDRESTGGARLLEIAQGLVDGRFSPAAPSPAQAEGEHLFLSQAEWMSAKTGWGEPLRNRLPDKPSLISVGDHVYPRGLYAHAPASHRWDLDGKWSRLRGHAGLADGHDGQVIFAIMGDEKELWHSRPAKEGAVVNFDLSVAGMKTVELRTTPAGETNRNAWSVWVDPELSR